MTSANFSTVRHEKFLAVLEKSASATRIGSVGESIKNLQNLNGDGGKFMNDKDLSIVVQSTRGTKTLSFPKTAKISDVINAAVAAFGFVPGDRFELALATNPGEVLLPERPLVSYHVADGMVFLLTSIGGGV